MNSILMILLCNLCLSLVITTAQKKRTEGNHKGAHLQSIDTTKQQEHLAELYYNHQSTERRNPYYIVNDYLHINPNFPCLYGANVLGDSTKESIKDGHKYACGLHRIVGAPIVYSLGSNKQQDFELAVIKIRPDAKVYVFEIEEKNLPNSDVRSKAVNYNNIGLGYGEGINGKVPMLPLAEMMKLSGHEYIDVLKMDIEVPYLNRGIIFSLVNWKGAEWLFIEKELSLLSRIGQLLIEVHTYMPEWLGEKPSPLVFVEKIESMGLRLFHKEGNFMSSGCCMEWSFIQRDWSGWNSELKFKLNSMSANASSS